ncbi:DUF222 domain-containing protein [Mycobacterium yunnanensis]|uniref:DUF222 domain-containing protein n=1 Tax=Mycobacterium yunnanensis TaxID=368477 RepID=A0A9X2Z1F9_9MYCO|nr:HNH endonuclease signature motif containing protein [Mycobacterium yunnanensis]MCV7421074.1 DUF222 domain-containing protein [Mycobacterium yunnanensis]
MFDDLVDATTGTRGAGALSTWARVENAACAHRVATMAAMLDETYALSGSADRDQWCLDNLDAVAAHIGAAQNITPGAASHQLLIAVALHDRFPRVAAVFAEGLITYALVKTVVHRGALVIDPDALRALDALLAEAFGNWELRSVDKTEKAIDVFVHQVDPHAVRRSETKARGRSVEVHIEEDGSGMATVLATLFAHDAKAFEARLRNLAKTVCPADPRTADQLRADAVGAIGTDRMACLCGNDDCAAAQNPPATGVVVYVIASDETLADPTATPESEPPAPRPETPAPPPEAPEADAPPISEESAERAAIDGEEPPLFDKPLRDLTLTEALTPAPGYFAKLRPAAMMGGQFLPGAVACRAAVGATITRVVHPGQTPPEMRYRPSKKLADFIRCRDMTCRFPGCRIPANQTDIDHTIPWPHGPTAASNLKCVCRRHHLLKTFWGGENGWQDTQLDDGTVIWTAPDGREFVTTPGSRLLFPELSAPTAAITPTGGPTPHTAGLTMPRRKTTRAQDHARRVERERELNELENELGADDVHAGPGDGEFLVGGDDEHGRARRLEGDPSG